MGLMELVMACYLGLHGILTGPTKSTDHPSGVWQAILHQSLESDLNWGSTNGPYIPLDK